MEDIKWFKLFTGFHNNRKIKQLKRLPNGAEFVCCWVFLLDLAAAVNDDGLVYFTQEIPYTDEMLAAEFDIPVPLIRQAMQLFEKFGMIEIVNDIAQISNWARYQNVESLDRVREQTKLRTRAWRERKRLEAKTENDTQEPAEDAVTSHETSQKRKSDGVERRKKKEERRKEKEEGEGERITPAPEACGIYNNVFLTDQEQRTLYAEIGDAFRDYIDDLSSYKQSSGKEYADDFATIRRWAAKDREEDSRNETEDTRWLRMAEAWAKKHEEEDNA